MRLLLSSNSPLVGSGYGYQTALMAPRIKAQGHEVAIHCFWGHEGCVIEWNGIRLYPKHVHPFGMDIVGAHAQHFGAEAILTLIDAWVVQPELFQGVPWVSLAPIDHDPAPPQVLAKLRQAYLPIAYSKFGLEQMVNAGLDARYVPHMVDCKVFAPIDRKEARERLGWPQDRFIVGMVAANKGFSPCRKAFPEHIAGFAKFKKKHPDALLYLHTNLDLPPEWQPIQLTQLIEHHGLRPQLDVAWVSQYDYYTGSIQPAALALMYNSLDVFMNVSRGEGFGVPAVEAQACGVPVISGGWTAMPELVFAGWTIPKSEAHADWTVQGSYMFVARQQAIAERLELAYKQSGSETLQRKAREGALQYDADDVAERYWRPVLAELEDRLSRPVAVAGPLEAAA